MSRLVERIKLGIIGQSGVGKTHFLHGFLFADTPKRTISPTLAVQFYEKVMMVGEEEVSLRVWDTSGQEKYRPIVGYHLQECQVLIFMYDLTDLETFYEIQTWIARLKKDGMDLSSKKLIFIGNKLDLVREDSRVRQVKYEDVKETLLKLRLPTSDIYEVTSNDMAGRDIVYIHEILEQILTEVLSQRTEDQLTKMRVKLGAQGILATEQEAHAGENQYCGECNIF